MKKNTLIYLCVLILFIIGFSLIFFSSTKNEITDKAQIEKLVADSNLELLLNLGDFSKENYSDEKLLEVAMLYAQNNSFLNESTENDMYIEYINYSDLHNIINELTGISIEAPIQIEDFYYRYDSENEYYYSAGLEIPTYQISNINSVYNNDNIYTIECSTIKTVDGEIIEQKNVITEIKKVKTSEYSNYKVLNQQFL